MSEKVKFAKFAINIALFIAVAGIYIQYGFYGLGFEKAVVGMLLIVSNQIAVQT